MMNKGGKERKELTEKKDGLWKRKNKGEKKESLRGYKKEVEGRYEKWAPDFP